MEHLVALLSFGILSFATFYFFSRVASFMLKNIQVKVIEHAKRASEQVINKDKLLQSISVIHSTTDSNTLNGALRDFNQSIAYHETHNVKFLDKDLGRLNVSISKFARYKALKLYGLDLQKEALRDYLTYIRKTTL